MSAHICQSSQSDNKHPIIGICLEESCQNSPLVCKLCSKGIHQGHLIISYDYLHSSEKKVTNATISAKVLSVFGKEQEKIYDLVVKQCRGLAQQSLKICQKFNTDKPFLPTLTNSFQKQKMSAALSLMASNHHQVPPEAIKRYLKLLRCYYFEGGFPLNAIKTESRQIEKHFNQFFSQAQSQIKSAIDSLQQKILNYNPYSQSAYGAIKAQTEPNISFISIEEPEKASQNRMVDQTQILQSEQMHQRRLLRKFNLSRNQCTQFEIVVLRQTKECKLSQIINYIDPVRIKQLTLLNSASTCVVNKQMCQKISAMTNLKVLKLFWARDLTDVAVCNMIKYMNDLQVLMLCQFSNCSPMLVKAIKINNPCLKKICFSMYMNKFIRLSQQTLQFLPDIAYQYLTQNQWIDLTNGLQDLSNLELHDPENKRHWATYISENAQKLRQFTLSNIDQTQDSKFTKQNSLQDFTSIIKALSSSKYLNFLRFQQAQFNENQLVKVFQNNPRLQTFISNQCHNMTQKSFEALAKHCLHLEQIIIMMNDKITSSCLSTMTSLKTLVIRGCWGIQQNEFINTLNKLKDLNSLSVDYNYQWVSGKTLRAVSGLKDLKLLSINGNGLTGADIKNLQNSSILTLMCSSNMFCYTDLLNLPMAQKLKRLSVGKNIKTYSEDDSLEKINMKLVVQGFPSLTHLKLKGFKNIKPEFLELMSRLISLTIVECQTSDTNQCKKYCMYHQISFFDNEA